MRGRPSIVSVSDELARGLSEPGSIGNVHATARAACCVPASQGRRMGAGGATEGVWAAPCKQRRCSASQKMVAIAPTGVARDT